jgi:hypothetical protein
MQLLSELRHLADAARFVLPSIALALERLPEIIRYESVDRTYLYEFGDGHAAHGAISPRVPTEKKK